MFSPKNKISVGLLQILQGMTPPILVANLACY